MSTRTPVNDLTFAGMASGPVRHHSRSGKLNKPESCHDAARAAALNMMQAPGKATVDLVINSGSLLALLRVSSSASGWLPHSVLIGSRYGLVSRADLMALVHNGFCEELKKGIEITDKGNELVRALVTFAHGFKIVGGGVPS